jgi:hypothetical protein
VPPEVNVGTGLWLLTLAGLVGVVVTCLMLVHPRS